VGRDGRDREVRRSGDLCVGVAAADGESDKVFGTCDGSFAEYARAQPSRLAPKPANLSFERTASTATT
jgi:NADPH:quinone reductase-like Zn-dependent oxidoreductase